MVEDVVLGTVGAHVVINRSIMIVWFITSRILCFWSVGVLFRE